MPRYGAHATSPRHYDRIRDHLTAAVRRHVKRFPKDRDLIAFVEGVDLPDSALVALHRSDLWEITPRFAAIELLVTHEMKAIHRLEATDPPSPPGTPPDQRAASATSDVAHAPPQLRPSTESLRAAAVQQPEPAFTGHRFLAGWPGSRSEAR